MQYTFSVAPPPVPVYTLPQVKKPSPSSAGPRTDDADHDMVYNPATPHNPQIENFSPAEIQLPESPLGTDNAPSPEGSDIAPFQQRGAGFSTVVRFPALFSSDFTPTALLGSGSSTRSNSGLSYGEDVTAQGSDNEEFAVSRPAFEFPLDELMDSPDARTWSRTEIDIHPAAPTTISTTSQELSKSFATYNTSSTSVNTSQPQPVQDLAPITTQFYTPHDHYVSAPSATPSTISPTSPSITGQYGSPTTSVATSAVKGRPRSSSKHGRDEDTFIPPSSSGRSTRHSHSASVPNMSLESTSFAGTTTTSSRRNSLKAGTRQPPSATPPPRAQRAGHGHAPPGGVKSECANCGATSTPLWRRGLNDELNCNVSLPNTSHDLYRVPKPLAVTSRLVDYLPSWLVRVPIITVDWSF